LWASVIIVVSSIPGPEIPGVEFRSADKIAHFLEYLLLGVLLIFGFRRRKILLWGAGLGVFDEFHQLFIPGRHCSLLDLAMNFLGLAVSPLVFTILSRLGERIAK
jgi:VanZ family protein